MKNICQMKNKIFTILPLLIIAAVLMFRPAVYSKPTASNPALRALSTRSITDMYGRKLIVPATINRVLTYGPIEMELVYMLAPDKLVGLSFTFNGKPPLVQDKYRNLPVVGGRFGTQTANYEILIAAEPDIILDATEDNIKEIQDKMGEIPVVGLAAGKKKESNFANDSLTGYEEEIRFLGDLLDVQAQAESLINYYKNAMKYVTGIVSGIPDKDKVRVYYAEGKEGLSTDPADSVHTKLLQFCGGINVASVALKPGSGQTDVSMEQIIIWDPDMIIIGRSTQAGLFNTVMTDDRWSLLRAVKNKKVAVRPDNPFSWYDGPPGPCQMIGMYWMINKLYPERTKGLDLNARVKEFYSKFFHYELRDDQLHKLLANPE